MSSEDVRLHHLGRGDPRLEAVEALFQQMYDYQETVGLRMPLTPDGASRWIHSVSGVLGRLGCLVAADIDSEVVGFIHGSLLIVPEYLSSGRVGRINHLFVQERARSAGVARRLAEAGIAWLKDRGASSIELQVLVGNEPASRFWESLGFELELHQMRKSLD